MLLFRLKWSLWVFTKIMWCMVQYWWQMGIFITLYIDDFTVMARSKE